LVLDAKGGVRHLSTYQVWTLDFYVFGTMACINFKFVCVYDYVILRLMVVCLWLFVQFLLPKDVICLCEKSW
jgi:hypothetical protein